MDISKIWPGWTITERLGHGGFGHVYKATYAETDAVAAVKVITIPDNPDIIEDLRYSGRSDDEILDLCHEEAERMMEEIKVMQKLKRSANIVSIEDTYKRYPCVDSRFFPAVLIHGIPVYPTVDRWYLLRGIFNIHYQTAVYMLISEKNISYTIIHPIIFYL